MSVAGAGHFLHEFDHRLSACDCILPATQRHDAGAQFAWQLPDSPAAGMAGIVRPGRYFQA